LPAVTSDSSSGDGDNSAGAGTGSELALSKLFASCSPEQAKIFYTPVRRSVRIHGHSTTIRLEQAFWTVMESMAEDEGVTVAGMITLVHDHCQFSDQKNLASCLRVLCLKYIEG
jgi:predicted DNA-binding ribbon-helix-helix protein